MFSELTNKELAAIQVIHNLLMRSGRMPSVRELMRELNYKSPRSVSVILEGLIDKEVLRKRDDGSLQLLAQETAIRTDSREQTVKVPLIGTIACGPPILAEENIEAEFSVSVKLAKMPGKYFMLRAVGDSMNQKGINEGDLLLIKQQETADNGDLVVALIDNEATVKELRKNEYTTVLVPHSSNKIHTPIILTHDFKVQGVVVTVIPGI